MSVGLPLFIFRGVHRGLELCTDLNAGPLVAATSILLLSSDSITLAASSLVADNPGRQSLFDDSLGGRSGNATSSLIFGQARQDTGGYWLRYNSGGKIQRMGYVVILQGTDSVTCAESVLPYVLRIISITNKYQGE